MRLLSNDEDDLDLITKKDIKNISAKLYIIMFITIFNTIALIFICGFIINYVGSINTIVDIVNQNKDRINSTIDTIVQVSGKVNTITDIILNFRSIAKNKIVTALCNNYFTYQIIGKYLCSNNTNTSYIPMNNMKIISNEKCEDKCDYCIIIETDEESMSFDIYM